MASRLLELDPHAPGGADAPPRTATPGLVMRSPPNWTAIGFFAVLGSLHYSIALPAFLAGHPEGCLSLTLGTAFLLAATAAWRLCRTVAILPAERRVRLRTGLWRLRVERSVGFARIDAVRVHLPGPAADPRIELLCRDGNAIDCPVARAPAAQQALLLALLIHARLIKVYDAPGGEERMEDGG